MRTRTAVIPALAATLALAPAAMAHVTANPGEAVAGGFAKIDFRVPHGCEDSPTTRVSVRIPESIPRATPEAVPGWSAVKRMVPLAEPIDDGHGGRITERVASITWTGGPLPADQLTDFGISMRMPDTPGATVDFPTVQTCREGEHRWIEIPEEGQDRFDLDEPAPAVTLVAAGDDAGGGGDGADRADLALGLGAGGLLAGLAALGLTLAGRRRPA